MTGQYPTAIGTIKNGNGSEFRSRLPGIVTMSQFLRKRGYYAARVSKIYHMGIPGDILAGTEGVDDPLSWDEAINILGPEQNAPGDKEDLSPLVTHQGVDFVKVEADGDDLVHADGMTAEHAVRLLGELKNKNFFLGVGLVRPHVPLVAPRAYFDPYDPNMMEIPFVPEGDLDDVPEAAQTQSNEVKYGMSEEQQRKTLGAYYASIAYMDAQVGKLLDELDRLNLTEKTIVVFTSDHGYNMGQHTCWQKLSLWEDSVRVPFIVSVPWLHRKAKDFRRTYKVTELIDLYPTIADLCGYDVPDNLPGQSLRPLLEDPQGKGWKEKPAYTITKSGGDSLRTNRYRYNEYNKGKDGVELYDHQSDPQEFTNLAVDPAYASLVAEMKQQMETARQRASELNI
jgi:arylsulfatase A-like enzyme